MKNSKLKTLLLGVDQSSSDEDVFINLNDEVSLKLRSMSGGVVNNGTCNSNGTCDGNSTCTGNKQCAGNDTCNGTCTP